MDGTLAASLLVLGAATGFAAGLLGIGGGMLLVPFLTLLFTARGFPSEHIVHMAIATSLATILFTSLSSVRAHHRRGAVLWPVVRLFAPGILIGSLAGARVAGWLPTFWLALGFAVFVAFSATQMLLDRKPAPNRELPQRWGMFGAGLGIGVLSSFVGAGGGFISVPFMVWCNVRIHNAVATSAALGFPIAAAGTVGYVWAGLREPGLPAGSLGFVYLPALAAVVAASVFTAPLGARVAHALDVRRLKRVFAVLLYLLAAYMLYKAIRTY
ncbi:MAG: sulfite exporter TauE/SafE family protein [Burkholderiaceae bacterium]|nr:sulfite exporter TauE/SafE family protein [Burkholderiaceae bacterium]